MKLFKRLILILPALMIVLGLFPGLTSIAVRAQDDGLESSVALALKAWAGEMEPEATISAMQRLSENIYPSELILKQELSGRRGYCQVWFEADAQAAQDFIRGAVEQNEPNFEWKLFHGLDAVGLPAEDFPVRWRIGRLIIYVYTPFDDTRESNEAMWRAMSGLGLVEPDDTVTPPVPTVVADNISGNDLAITIQTSKAQYVQGEAVVLTGKLLYQGEPVDLGTGTGDIKGSIGIDIGVPFSDLDDLVHDTLVIKETNAAGEFSVMPFAGYSIGEYTLQATAGLRDTRYPKDSTKSDPITLKVNEIDLWETVSLEGSGSSLAQIQKLYKAQVSDGPVRQVLTADLERILNAKVQSSSEFGVAAELVVAYADAVGLQSPPESTYGSINNILEYTSSEFTPFTCGSYQGKVMRFFAGLQFNEDPDIRALMRGLDYGPVARGYGLLGGHHAVSLHPMEAPWSTLAPDSITLATRMSDTSSIDALDDIRRVSRIFDPWPKQTPEVYSVADFEGLWGNLKIDPYELERTDTKKIFTGVPMTGAGIYTNPFFSLQAANPAPPLEKSSVAVNCPVDVLVTDASGKRVGMLPDGTLVQEFAANVHRLVENGETQGWYFGLDEGRYDFEITGTADGSFHLEVSGDLADGGLLDYGEQPIATGEQARVNLDKDDPGTVLTLADGTTVTPTALDIGGSRGGGEMSRWLLIGIAVGSFLLALGLAVLLKFLPIRARLIVFLVVLLGGLLGGIFGSGHNFAAVIAAIQGWSSG